MTVLFHAQKETTMPGLIDELFGKSLYGSGLKSEDQSKAQALLGVVCKSTASLGDVVLLADALGLKLKFVAESKLEPETSEQ